MIKSLQPLAERQQQPPEAFMWVGRLVSYKRPLEYVALARALPEAKFWMIGVSLPHLDEDRLVAEKVILAAEKVPNLRLLAPRPHTEVGALLSRAVAAVNTSEFEGMPNVLLEAWSRGVPALVLKHDPGGVVATHGLGGFASGSLEKLVELARAQWLERNHRPQLAARCRNYIETHHSPDLIAEQWAHVIRDTSPRAIETSAPEAEAPCAA
jgi:glycosyltransferase involved in cell wall biosynthesis